ncbi:hypothetical protein EV421DRAFT_1746046 [Armillaria borealis]|uniref:Uncharacterized protein n=1 Tax=Armillaria borealis TaxID=47425 RepID=A0AA39M4Y4_9AGAR|nr:hypothetical protein EV421DRAFT_1746046 [Armillaria borealis]
MPLLNMRQGETYTRTDQSHNTKQGAGGHNQTIARNMNNMIENADTEYSVVQVTVWVKKQRACLRDCEEASVSGYCKPSGTRFGAKDMPGAIREPMTATKRRHQGTARKERRDFITKPHVSRRTVAYDCSDCNGTQ